MILLCNCEIFFKIITFLPGGVGSRLLDVSVNKTIIETGLTKY